MPIWILKYVSLKRKLIKNRKKFFFNMLVKIMINEATGRISAIVQINVIFFRN